MIRPPPTIITSLILSFFKIRNSLKKDCSSFVRPVSATLSPLRITVVPLGMSSSPSRSTMQNNTLWRYMFAMSMTFRPASGEFSKILISAISSLVLANDCVRIEEVNRSDRRISRAATSSGLISSESPSSSLTMFSEPTYSGERMRAIVCRAPSLRASRQLIILISSLDVAAITTSACWAPASFSVSGVAPLPSTPTTSSELIVFSRTDALLSITVTLWPS